jgi:hypothetical protein
VFEWTRGDLAVFLIERVYIGKAPFGKVEWSFSHPQPAGINWPGKLIVMT